jgi:hypothetical protein
MAAKGSKQTPEQRARRLEFNASRRQARQDLQTSLLALCQIIFDRCEGHNGMGMFLIREHRNEPGRLINLSQLASEVLEQALKAKLLRVLP